MRKIASLLSLLGGALLIFTAAIPLFYTQPYGDGPNSGPSNLWEFIRMAAYDSWALFLIIGILLSLTSVLGLRGKFLHQ